MCSRVNCTKSILKIRYRDRVLQRVWKYPIKYGGTQMNECGGMGVGTETLLFLDSVEGTTSGVPFFRGGSGR